MTQLRLNVAMVTATIILFILTLYINELIFNRFEFARGINWVYLPAGVRLLSTLLFGGAGAIGLLIVSWLVCFFYFFPDDVVRSFMGGIIAAAAPYMVYRIAEHFYGLHATLANLTPKRLLVCVAGYAFASPLLHHIWFFLHGDRQDFFSDFFVMFAGDLFGSLIVVYSIKMSLSVFTAFKKFQSSNRCN